MSVEEQLKNLICERYGTQIAFSEKIGMPNSSLNTFLRRGVRSASINTVMDICQELGISANELAKGYIVPLEKMETDITTAFSNLRLNASQLSLDGQPLTEAEIAVIFDSVENALNCIRRLR